MGRLFKLFGGWLGAAHAGSPPRRAGNFSLSCCEKKPSVSSTSEVRHAFGAGSAYKLIRCALASSLITASHRTSPTFDARLNAGLRKHSIPASLGRRGCSGCSLSRRRSAATLKVMRAFGARDRPEASEAGCSREALPRATRERTLSGCGLVAALFFATFFCKTEESYRCRAGLSAWPRHRPTSRRASTASRRPAN